MNRPEINREKLADLLQPESALEAALLAAPEFQRGLIWGEPRFGHPEGAVVLHVREVLANIEQLPGLSASNRTALRLIAFSHDTFKYCEDRSRPRDWSRHHGLLARRFMENYTRDETVLDIIELHDDAYYQWLSASKNPDRFSFARLHERVGHCMQLYYQFFKCDTQTGDKTQAPLRWFEHEMGGIQPVVIKPFWPWEKF